MSAGIWRLSGGPINVQNPSVLLGREWEKCNQTPYSPFDGQFDEREQVFCSFLLPTRSQQFFCNIHPKPNQVDPASFTDVFAPQPEPRNEALQTDLQEGFYEASFLEEDTEHNIVIHFAPPESFTVELEVRSVTEGKPKFVYEIEEP